MTSNSAPRGADPGIVEAATAGLPRVTLVACGGTIATVPTADAVLQRTGAELLDSVEAIDTLADLDTRDVISKPSHLMTLDDVATVAAAACHAAEQPGVSGVVVTHGTDILEEVAYLTDLWHDGDAPIIFTGAQRNAASPDGDGPGNIHDSIRVAVSPSARGIGVVLCFAGQVFPAVRVRKVDTISLHAFDALGDVLGRISSGEVRLYARHDRPSAIRPRRLGRCVHLVRLCAAADGTLVDAAVAGGAEAIVLESFGAGTAPAEVVDSVAAATARGVLVLFVSRCERGGLWSQPGRGNYDDLVEAGAVPLQDLDGAKARMRLLALIGACNGDLDRVRATLLNAR